MTALPLPWSASWRRGAPLGWASTARCAGKRRTETTRLEENSRVVFSYAVVSRTTRSGHVSIPPLWLTVANATLCGCPRYQLRPWLTGGILRPRR